MKERENRWRVTDIYWLEQMLAREYDDYHRHELAKYRDAHEDDRYCEFFDDGKHLTVEVGGPL